MRNRIFLAIGALLVAVASSPFWLPPLLDWNAFKETFERLAADASGFEISINGDIDVGSVLPVLRVSVTEIEARSEAPDAPPPLSMESVDLEMAFWPLLRGILDVRRFHVDGLRFAYTVDEWGRPQGAKRVGAEQPNIDTAADPTAEKAPLITDVRLADVRVTNSTLIYENRLTGQIIRADEVALSTRLANLASPLELSAELTLNDRRVTLTASLESPSTLLAGNGARLVTKIESDILQADVDLKIWIEPTLRADGSIDVHIPSAGTLARWLGRPLGGTEDPGALRLSGKISSTDAKTTLHNLSLSGEDWDLKVSGEVAFDETPTRLSLNVEGDRIDLDRYLPKPVEGPRTVRLGSKRSTRKASALDEPIDLSMLRDFRGEVWFALEGLKAGGFEVGKTAFRARFEDGVIDAELGELSLYGGRLVGFLSVDASGSEVALNAKLAIDQIDLDSMSDTRGVDTLVRGKLNGFINLNSSGATPRSLIKHLAGAVLLELNPQGEIDPSEVKNQPTITGGNLVLLIQRELKSAGLDPGPLDGKMGPGTRAAIENYQAQHSLTIDGRATEDLLRRLQGVSKVARRQTSTTTHVISWANAQLIIPEEGEPPYILGRLIYAGELVEFDIESESLPKMITGQAFGLDASFVSKLMSLRYQGDIYQSPILSLDGDLNATIPSAGQLAAWLGVGLPSDPGPVSFSAGFESDGTTGRIIEARIQGKDLDVELRGDFDLSGDVSQFNLQAKTGVLRIDRYLPRLDEGPDQREPETPSKRKTVLLFDDFPADALDFSVLRRLDVNAEIDIAGAVLPGATIGRALIKARAKDGRVTLTIDELDIDGGSVTGEIRFDGTSNTAALDVSLEGTRINFDVLAGFEQEPDKHTVGLGDFTVTAHTSGDSQKALVKNFAPSVEARLDSITLAEGWSLDEVSIKVSTDSPGSDIRFDMSGTLSDHGKADSHAVSFNFTTSPVTDWLANQSFAIQGSADIGEFHIQLKSEVDRPVTHFEPILEVIAEGESLAEIDSILKIGLPIVEPYRIEGRLLFSEAKIEVSSFDLALGRSKVSGAFTMATDEERPVISGQINFETLDLAELTGDKGREVGVSEQDDAASTDIQAQEWIFSEEPLPFELLSLVDIPAMEIAIAKLQIAPDIAVENVRAEVLLKDGKLHLSLVSGQLYDGKIEGDFKASAAAPNSVDLVLSGIGMDYGAILVAFDITEKLRGRMDVQIDVTGQGSSLRTLASGLSGRFDLEAQDGQIDRAMVGVLAFGAGAILGPLFGDDSTGELRCIVTTIEFEDGIGDTLVQYYETNFFAVGGKGKIDLKSETLDFIYNPKGSQTSLMKLAVPFRVSGPILAPSVNPDTGGTLLKVATTAGIVASFINPLVGLGVLATGAVIGQMGGCETARAIKRGDIPREEPGDEMGGSQQVDRDR